MKVHVRTDPAYPRRTAGKKMVGAALRIYGPYVSAKGSGKAAFHVKVRGKNPTPFTATNAGFAKMAKHVEAELTRILAERAQQLRP